MLRSSLLVLLLLLPWEALQADELEASAVPARVVLGQTDHVEVLLRRPTSGPALHGHANVGTLRALDAGTGAQARWEWSPPTERFPRTAILVFWAPQESQPEVTVLRIPLVGRLDLAVDTEPSAQVRVEVAGTSFGPMRASVSGRALVPIEVPPDVREAQVLAEVRRHRTTRAVPLDVPEAERLTAAFLTEAPSVDEGGWLVVAGVTALEPSALRLEVERASVRVARSEGDHVLYQVMPEPSADQVRVTVDSGSPGDTPLTLTASVRAVLPSPLPSLSPKVATRAPAFPTFSFFVSGGGFLGGGSYRGPLFALGGGYALPFWEHRLHGELELNVRAAHATLLANGLGTVDSSLRLLSLLIGARYEVQTFGRFQLSGRAGGGLRLFRHEVDSDFQTAFQEGGQRPELFLGAQLATPVGPAAVYLELRGSYAPFGAQHLQAPGTGAEGLIGIRYTLP